MGYADQVFDLTGKVVVVTGGSRGLGLGIAQKLAAAGYRTIAVARKKNKDLTAAMSHADREGRGGRRCRHFAGDCTGRSWGDLGHGK